MLYQYFEREVYVTKLLKKAVGKIPVSLSRRVHSCYLLRIIALVYRAKMRPFIMLSMAQKGQYKRFFVERQLMNNGVHVANQPYLQRRHTCSTRRLAG